MNPQQILAQYNEAESLHLLNSFPLISSFIRRVVPEDKNLLLRDQEYELAHCSYKFNLPGFSSKHGLNEYMEKYGKPLAIQIGERIERNIHSIIMKDAKKRYSIDSNKAKDDLGASIQHVFDNDISKWKIDEPRRLKGFFPKDIIVNNTNNLFVRDDEALNSWDMGDLLVKDSLDSHYVIRCFIHHKELYAEYKGFLIAEDAIVLKTYRPPSGSPFLKDIYYDEDTGFSKLKVYARSQWATGGYGMVDAIYYSVYINPDCIVLLDFV